MCVNSTSLQFEFTSTTSLLEITSLKTLKNDKQKIKLFVKHTIIMSMSVQVQRVERGKFIKFQLLVFINNSCLLCVQNLHIVHILTYVFLILILFKWHKNSYKSRLN